VSVRLDATPWARKAMTPEDRAAIVAAIPDGASVFLSCAHPPRPAIGGYPARPGVYLAAIIRYPSQWTGEGSTPLAAFSRALVEVPSDVV
jgi:hypothetical protein